MGGAPGYLAHAPPRWGSAAPAQAAGRSCIRAVAASCSRRPPTAPAQSRVRGRSRGAGTIATRWAGSPAASWPTAPRPSVPSRWPSGWAASTPPPPSWALPGRRCGRPSPATGSGCPRATLRRSASAPSTPPTGAGGGRPPLAWTRCLWRSTTAGFPSGRGRVGSWPSGFDGRRTTRCSVRGWWWSCTPKATPRSPARGRGQSPDAPNAPTAATTTASSAASGARPIAPAAPTDRSNPR
jgi:hypothetical protein